jgi:hypothetical protein
LVSESASGWVLALELATVAVGSVWESGSASLG